MKKNKQTSEGAASSAARVLSSIDTGAASKSAAASALTQKGNNEATGAKAATAASKVLRDGRTSKDSKSAAGSALSQTQKRSVTRIKNK